MGPLPTTQNDNKYIMVVIDHSIKYSEAYALPSHTASDVSDAIVTQFISIFGIPKQILSDQGPELMSDVLTNLCIVSSTGFTLNKQLFGRELNSIIEAQLPRLPKDTPTPSCPLLYIQWLQSSLHSRQQAARDNIDRAYRQQN